MLNMNYPLIILLLSGKRKSGKDFIAEKLMKTLQEKCTLKRISGPVKGLYAKEHNLDFEELLKSTPYKEKYRIEMIQWSDSVRLENPGYFCEAACKAAENKPVWIVSDIRRKTDVKWFKETYESKVKLIRIVAEDLVRRERGWTFTEGVDDVASECDLDDFKDWDLVISNNNDIESKECLEKILFMIKSTMDIAI